MEVRIPHKLSSDAQLILQIIFEYKPDNCPVTELNKAFHVIYPMNSGLSSAINIYAGKFKLNSTFQERKLIHNELIGLQYLGLVYLSEVDVERKNSHSSFTSTNEEIVCNYIIQMTDEGKRIAQAISENRRLILRPKKQEQTTVFIACAFGKAEIDDLCDIHLIPACSKLGYKPIRVDRSEPERSITEQIMKEIEQAAAMIADLTFARPSVYFEIGYAIGLGIPIILTCRNDHLNGTQDNLRVHFDLAQYKISFWNLDESNKYKWSDKKIEPANRLEEILKENE